MQGSRQGQSSELLRMTKPVKHWEAMPCLLRLHHLLRGPSKQTC